MIRRALLTGLLAVLTLPAAAQAQCSSNGAVQVCITPPATVSGNAVLLQPSSTAGNPSRVTYTLDGSPLLVAFDPPYGFRWPTTRYANGAHTLRVFATGTGAVTTPVMTFPVTVSNATSPPAPGVFHVRRGTTPPPGRPYTIAAGGDGASGEASSTTVTNEIASWSPNMLLYLGDVYESGTPAEFWNWYGQATHQWFDRFNAITNPVVGNHEYLAGNRDGGYVGYWGTGSDLGYSYNVAGWHLIALNSNSQLQATGAAAQEVAWLKQDLAKVPPSTCTLAYYHHPMQNSGPEGEPAPNSITTQLWGALLGRADVVLNGHDHDYQRYKPVSGVTEFVVGTTGHSRQAPQPDPRLATFFADVFGALRAELNPHGFSYRFIDDSGAVLDSGVIPCHGAKDTQAPAAPTGLRTDSVSRTTAALSWQTPRDDVGVTAYDVIRNGVVIGTTTGATRFVDASVQAGTAYRYAVRARDTAGHIGAPSAPITVLPSSIAFLDSFESGNLAAWTAHGGPVSVTTTAAHVGRFGLHVAAAGTPAYVSKSLVTSFGTLETLMRVRITARTTVANLVTFADGAGQRIVTVRSHNAGNVCFLVGTVATAHCGSAARIDDGQWHTLRVTVTTGSSSRVRILLDEHQVLDDTSTALGSAKIGRLVLGTGVTTNGQTYAADFDLVAADPLPIGDIVSPTPPTGLAAHAVSGLRVDLSWRRATDDTGVTGYDVFRNGEPVAITGPTPSFADTTVDGLASYVYAVRARDAAGNVSPLSSGAGVDTPIVLRETFDRASSLRRFSPAAGLQWNRAQHALRLHNGAHGRIALPEATTRLYARVKFRVATRAANPVPLLALRSATGTVLAAGLDAGGHLGAALPASRQWHDLQVHADVQRRLVEVWLDGEQRDELTATLPAGRPPITAIELGGPGVYDLLEDRLEANTRFMTDTVRPTAPRRVTATVVRSRTVSVRWTAAHDDIRVSGYRIFRGGIEIGRTSSGHRTFIDRFAPPGARVIYGVRATDAAGNLSAVRRRAFRVPFLAELHTRRIRAHRTIRFAVPAVTHAATLSLRVRAHSTPRRAIVARYGRTTLRFPRAARRDRFVTLRIRVRHPGPRLVLGGAVAIDVRSILIR
jgi:chitodextrinase